MSIQGLLVGFYREHEKCTRHSIRRRHNHAAMSELNRVTDSKVSTSQPPTHDSPFGPTPLKPPLHVPWARRFRHHKTLVGTIDVLLPLYCKPTLSPSFDDNATSIITYKCLAQCVSEGHATMNSIRGCRD